MFERQQRNQVRRTILTVMWMALALLVQPFSVLYAQSPTGTLSGTVYDPSGAAIAGAQIELKNEASGDIRTSVSNGSGYFAITAITPSSYTAKVSAPGFKTWIQNGVIFTQGETRSLPNIRLVLGEISEQVNVTAEAVSSIPMDTGEVSTTFNNYMVSELSVTGRDAGELIKFMPGMGLNNGLGQGASFTDKVVGTNSGPVGAYSANGTQPNGAMAYILDGANVLDSNMGMQVANINQDMTSEVKVMTSSYNAEFAKGPVVFEAFSKSGGQSFHGGAYLYTRNANFNAEDAFQKNQGLDMPYDSYYYIGGNVGGPVILPKIGFNKNRNKLFFWYGYEYMKQQPAGTLYEFFVPTPDMRAGDFSAATLASLPSNVPGGDSTVPCGGGPSSCNAKLDITDGQIQSLLDPDALALLKLMPPQNADPVTHGGNNYTYLANQPQNRWESNARIDYALSDNTKIWGTYIRQDEKDQHPFTVWWAPSSSLPYPSMIVAPTTSNVAMANITHVFGPTATNELAGSYVRYANANKPENKASYSREAAGYTGGGLFNAETDQIPNLVSWGGSFGGFYAPSFDGPLGGGAFGKILRNWSIYDNFTKVFGRHTTKFGFNWETNGNEQSSGGGNIFYQGLYAFDTWSGVGTGNPVADFLIGHSEQYSQANLNAVDDGYANTYAFYAQDSWKVTKRLTVNYGIRADHIGQWYFPKPGMQVFDPDTYDNTSSAPANTGLLWHGIDSHIPLSGFRSQVYWDPRGSLAYDVFGDARTVVRGGFALYRYPLGDSSANAAEGAMGVYQYQTPIGINSLAGISAFSPSSLNQNGTSITALQKGDGRMPRTEDYNLTVSQAAPWNSVFELSYVGNQSQDLLIDGALANINLTPMGALFQPDPVTGAPADPSGNINVYDYKPYRNYQTITLVRHGSYSNYNAMQVSWHKASGPVTWMTNYTWGKVLGIRDGESDNGPGNGTVIDLFNMDNNYGVLAYDHTHIFNAAYVVNLPKPIHGNSILGGAVNGWELSGGTSVQSGAPIQPNAGGNLYAQFPGSVSNRTYLGTDSIQLQPKLTCDPRNGIHGGMRFNPGCFAPPDPGTQGTIIWPYIKGPAYFNSDLSLFKNFKLKESQSVQFRFSAFNFLNHPLPQFNANGSSSDLKLNFISTDPVTGAQSLSQSNTNSQLTGKPAYEVGNRLVELAVKFNF